MVTPEAPVKVEKKAQTMIAITARPPGIQEKKALNSLISRSPARLSERMNPVRVNRGIAAMA